jgi:hypothetical protein
MMIQTYNHKKGGSIEKLALKLERGLMKKLMLVNCQTLTYEERCLNFNPK